MKEADKITENLMQHGHASTYSYLRPLSRYASNCNNYVYACCVPVCKSNYPCECEDT